MLALMLRGKQSKGQKRKGAHWSHDPCPVTMWEYDAVTRYVLPVLFYAGALPQGERQGGENQRTSSTGMLQWASTWVATEPITRLPKALWPWEPMTSRSNLPDSATLAMVSPA